MPQRAHLSHVVDRIRDSISTKCQTYNVINPNMTIHGVYTGISHYEHVPEYHRTCFSQFRMSAHRLRVEMGRWQRIPHDQRVCSCDHGGVQDERHVIEQCTYINAIREYYPHTVFRIQDIMNDKYVCEFIYKLCINMTIYSKQVVKLRKCMYDNLL